jgi:fatty acid desaturase
MSKMNAAARKRRAPVRKSADKSAQRSVELPTLALVFLVYGGWLGVTLAYSHWPLWIVAPLAAPLLTLHSSLQHEVLHGHPTRWRRLNRLIGIVPLSLWLPYERYRQTHLVHHVDERLTDPLDDPESYYWAPEQWGQLNSPQRFLVRLQTTLAGRILIGPFWSALRFWRFEWIGISRNQGRLRRIWLEHLIWCIPVVFWVTFVCRMPIWIYVLTMIVPGVAMLLIRSFGEHRARPGARERTAIVEGSWILGPLFLFNNLHSVHHDEPTMAWYEYNKRYCARRDEYLRENGGLVYHSYFDVARRYLFRPHDATAHPTGGIPREKRA